MTHNIRMSGQVLALATTAFIAAGMSYWYQLKGKKKLESKEVHERSIDTCSSTAVDLDIMQMFLAKSQDSGSDQVVCCVVLDGEVPTKEKVLTAVQVMQRRHCALRSVLCTDTNGKLRLCEQETPISGSVTICDKKAWRDVSDHCLNTVHFPLPSDDQPTSLWKVFLCTGGNEVAFVFVLNHVVFDGTSRNRFLHEFLSHLRPEKQQPVPEDCNLPIVNVKHLSEKTIRMSWPRFVYDCLGYAWNELWWMRHQWLYPLENAPGFTNSGTKKRTRQILFSLSEEVTTNLIKQCKVNGTTVHGALSAAGHRAMVLTAKDRGYKTPSKTFFGSMHLISLWKDVISHLGPNPINGVFISVASINICTDISSDGWAQARQIKADLQRFYPLQFSQFRYMQLCRNIVTKAKLLLGSSTAALPAAYLELGRTGSLFSISNNGRVSFDNDYNGTTVKAVFACSARHNVPGSLATLNVQTIRGKMHLGWSYYTQVWSHETAELFVKIFQKELGKMAHG